MAATVRATANGTTSASITPAVGDLFVVAVTCQGSNNTSPSAPTDDNGGTYTLVLAELKNSSADTLAVFVRTALLANTTATLVTPAVTGSTGTRTAVVAISGTTAVGSGAIVQSAGQANKASSTTPAPVFGGAANTANLVLGFVGNGGNPATMTPPTGWTENFDLGTSGKAVGLEGVEHDSGFTGTTVTWGSTSATAYASVIVEILSYATFNETVALAVTEALTIAASHSTAARAVALGLTETLTIARSFLTRQRTAALALSETLTIAASHTTLNRPAALALSEVLTIAGSRTTLNRPVALAVTEALVVAASHWTKARSVAFALTEAVTIAGSFKTLHRIVPLALTELLTIAGAHTTMPRPVVLALSEALTIAGSHKTLQRPTHLALTEALAIAYSVAYRPGPKSSWYYTWYGPRGHVFTDGWWGLTPDGSTNKAVGRLVSVLMVPATYSSLLGGETYESALVALETLCSNLGD